MLIVDSQIHIWENDRMSPQHRQIPTYSKDDALKEMAEAGVEVAVINPPGTLGEKANVLAVEAVRSTRTNSAFSGISTCTARSARPSSKVGGSGRAWSASVLHSTSRTSRAGGPTARSIGFGTPVRGRDRRSGCSPAGIMRPFAKLPRAIP